MCVPEFDPWALTPCKLSMLQHLRLWLPTGPAIHHIETDMDALNNSVKRWHGLHYLLRECGVDVFNAFFDLTDCALCKRAMRFYMQQPIGSHACNCCLLTRWGLRGCSEEGSHFHKAVNGDDLQAVRAMLRALIDMRNKLRDTGRRNFE